MTLAGVPGQPRAVEVLSGALRSGSVPHAYLFSGPKGVGKERAAVGLAQALLCRAKPHEGCGECADCRRIERRNHPDVWWVFPQAEGVERGLLSRGDVEGSPSRDIRVEQVRALQERLSLRALEAPAKVAIVLSAHRLNPQAQNALLKSLEEPPKDTYLLLLASAPEMLLPTLRSRMSRVEFGPLPRAVIAQALREEGALDPASAEVAAGMADGSLAQAKGWDKEALAARRTVFERFEALTASDLRPLLRFAEELGSSRESAQEMAALLSYWLRDALVQRVGNADADVINSDLRPALEETAGRHGAAALIRRREILNELTQALEQNGSPRLQLERALIRMVFEAGS